MDHSVGTDLPDEILVFLFEAQDQNRDLAGVLESLVAEHPELEKALRAFLHDEKQLGQLLPPGEPSVPFPEVAGYELKGKIDQGAMGIVYRAWDYDLERDVALKMIKSGALASPAARARFLEEARSAAGLIHPHIVGIFRGGEHAGEPFFSMEYVENGSLKSHLKRFQGQPRSIARLMEQVAEAVHFAHQRGILHRDLKPGNILMDRNDQPKVADFGLAQRLDLPARVHSTRPERPEKADPETPIYEGSETASHPVALPTTSGVAVGTPTYMAPEQARAESVLTVAVDVYALGVILFQLLTGKLPFRGDSVAELLGHVIHTPPPRPRSLDRRIPPDLEAICLRCLDKIPGERYPSARELADDLRRVQEGLPLDRKTRRTPFRERTFRWLIRQPIRAALLFAVLVLTGLLFGAGIWLLVMVPAEKIAIYEHALYLETLIAVRRNLENGQHEEARKILADCPVRQRCWVWNYLNRQCYQQTTHLQDHSGRVLAVCYNSTGDLLATGQQDGVVCIHNPHTAQRLHQFRAHKGEVRSLAFRANGDLVSAGADQVVRIWNPKTGEIRAALDRLGDTLAVTPPSGDRHELLAVASGRDRTLKVLEIDGNKVPSMDDLTFLPVSLAVSRDGPYLIRSMDDLTFLPVSVAFSRDSRYLAVVGFSHSILVLETQSGKVVLEKGPGGEKPTQRMTGNSWAVAFSPTSDLVVAGNEQPYSWELPSKSFGTFAGTGNLNCSCLVFSRNGEYLAATFRDKLIRIWNAQTRATVRVLDRENALVAVFSPDGKHLAVSQNNKVSIESFNSPGRLRSTLLPDSAAPEWSGLAVDGSRLAARDRDGRVVLWDLDQKQKRHTFQAPPNAGLSTLGALAFHGKELWSSGGERGLVGWRTDTGEALSLATEPTPGPVPGFALSPSRDLLAATNGKGEVGLWSWPRGDNRLTFRNVGLGEVACLGFSADGRFLALGGTDQVKVWNIPGATQGAVLSGHRGQVSCLAFAPNSSQRLASGCADLEVRIWVVGQPKPRLVCRGHFGQINGLAFSPDGRRLVSASHDGTLRVWDTETGVELLTLDEHGGRPVTAVAFQGGYLVSCGPDGVRVWDGNSLN
jgi:eukaryotic-like serine/threonine-protein kinase